MPSNLDYTNLTDISCAHDFWPAKARREPPFVGSTVFYPNLVDRSSVNPNLQGLSRDKIIQIEADHRLAKFSLNGHYGYTVIFDVVSDHEELVAKQIIEPIKRWRESFPQDLATKLPPMAPPCLLLRRLGRPGETFLSIDAVLYLRSLGVQLVGVESTAIAAPDNREAIESLMAEGDLSWLVRIDLSRASSNVPYMLCAFPIEPGATGPHPCRAVLIATSRSEQPVPPRTSVKTSSSVSDVLE